jgi:hypothetical protein
LRLPEIQLLAVVTTQLKFSIVKDHDEPIILLFETLFCMWECFNMGTELSTKVMLGQTLVLMQMTFLNSIRKVGRLVLSRTSCLVMAPCRCGLYCWSFGDPYCLHIQDGSITKKRIHISVCLGFCHCIYAVLISSNSLYSWGSTGLSSTPRPMEFHCNTICRVQAYLFCKPQLISSIIAPILLCEIKEIKRFSSVCRVKENYEDDCLLDCCAV